MAEEEHIRNAVVRQWLTILESDKTSTQEPDCTICLKPYQKSRTAINERQAKLRCGHVFGENCIITWLQETNTCPNCRARVCPEPPPSTASWGDFSGTLPAHPALGGGFEERMARLEDEFLRSSERLHDEFLASLERLHEGFLASSERLQQGLQEMLQARNLGRRRGRRSTLLSMLRSQLS